MEGLDTESKNGRRELEEGISSYRILFQEGSVGYSCWADRYFLLNSSISTEHELLPSKPRSSQFEIGCPLQSAALECSICATTPMIMFL